MVTRSNSHYSPSHLSVTLCPTSLLTFARTPLVTLLTSTLQILLLTAATSLLEIDVLIGLDYYWDLITGRTRRGSHGPVAVETKLCWILSGPAPTTSDSLHCSTLLTTSHSLKIDLSPSPNKDRQVVDLLQSFWDLETMGITETEHTLDDEFCDKITIRDGRYEVSLPWREVHKPLPDNRQRCCAMLL